MRRKIINPFTESHGKDDYKCFGCSPNNAIGLQMTFYDLGDDIEATWNLKKQFEGFPNVLHGGIQATLHDEIASWVVFTKCKTSGVTKTMNLTYHNPVFTTGGEIRVLARLVQETDKSATISTFLYNSEGKLCSEGNIEYFVFPLAVAKRKHFYPGVEAFYED